ncbi:MAG: peptidoglycan DD-metalloendopeptidase family protein [Pirellulales bacterium]
MSDRNWGAGQSSGNWYAFNSGWYAESSARHTAEIQLDSTNTVDETSDADNSYMFSFTPVTIALTEKFTWPEVGIVGVDRRLISYVDLDPTPGIRDYMGGRASNNGHNAIDTGAVSTSEMDAGIEILAAATGTVITAIDGNYDRNRGTLDNIVPGGAPNYVEIDHGGGLITRYFHMRRDSIRVRVGDRVNRGDVLGLEGSSGQSTASHLHFEVRYRGLAVETFLDANAFWVTPLPYVMNLRKVLSGGISNYDTQYHRVEGPSEVLTFSQADGQHVYTWFNAIGLRLNDPVEFIYTRPDSSLYIHQTFTVDEDRASSLSWSHISLPNLPDLGTWTVEFKVNAQLLKTLRFVVTPDGAPEARVEEFDPQRIVLDERSTPFDFGSVSLGADIPTQTFRLVNHGSAPLTVSELKVPDGFTVVDGLPNTLPAGASDLFTIGMSTFASGYKAGEVRILSDDADEAEYNFPVEGVVTSTQAKLTLGIGERRSIEGTQVIANVRRAAPTDQPLTVTLTSSEVATLRVPTTITIPAGSDGITFFLETVSDTVMEPKRIVTVSATAPGFNQALNTLDVVDRPALAISLDSSEVDGETGSTVLTVTRTETDLWKPIVVDLVSSHPEDLAIPATLTIPANSQAATLRVSPTPGRPTQRPTVVTLTAASADYQSSTTTLNIIDSRKLQLQLDSSVIKENGGAATMTIRRATPNIDNALTVNLTVNDSTEAGVPATAIIPAGSRTVSVLVTAIDDSLLDGSQLVILTASADQYVDSSISMQVTDFETLDLFLDASEASEHGGLVSATIRRNNSDILRPLTVRIRSSDLTEANVPQSIAIPSGQESASFTITCADDSILDGVQYVVIAVQADGYEGTAATLAVTDDERPFPWHNPRNALDVDDNGFVVPRDALVIINSLNTVGPRKLTNELPDPFPAPEYYDTNGDGYLSAIDALLVINYLNKSSAGEGEEYSEAVDLLCFEKLKKSPWS